MTLKHIFHRRHSKPLTSGGTGGEIELFSDFIQERKRNLAAVVTFNITGSGQSDRQILFLDIVYTDVLSLCLYLFRPPFLNMFLLIGVADVSLS
jgi:hypothetical protein